jgi:hypothetical protein
MALDSTQHKSSLCLRYAEDTFMSSIMAQSNYQDFVSKHNSLRPSIQVTTEIESDSAIAFLDVMFIRKATKLTTKVYRQPIHSGRYLNFKSNHPSQ